jgi:Flp pilus assembly protein CpaB
VAYFVVNKDVAARTLITRDIVTEIDAPADTVPTAALSGAAIDSGKLFSLVAMKSGSVVDSSVVGNLQPLTAGLPKGFVLASISVAPENAVGGRIKSGMYIDVAAVSGGDASATAKIVMQHVLVVDVTVKPQDVSSNSAASTTTSTSGTSTTGTTGSESPNLYNGIPQLYTLAVSAQDFAKLALIRNSNLYLAISASQTPDSLDVSVSGSQVFLPGSVEPSSPISGASSTTSTTGTSTTGTTTTGAADTTKSTIEAFYQKYKGNKDYNLTVQNGSLDAVTKATGEVKEFVDLKGGTFNLLTGLYTAATK